MTILFVHTTHTHTHTNDVVHEYVISLIIELNENHC